MILFLAAVLLTCSLLTRDVSSLVTSFIRSPKASHLKTQSRFQSHDGSAYVLNGGCFEGLWAYSDGTISAKANVHDAVRTISQACDCWRRGASSSHERLLLPLSIWAALRIRSYAAWTSHRPEGFAGFGRKVQFGPILYGAHERDVLDLPTKHGILLRHSGHSRASSGRVSRSHHWEGLLSVHDWKQ